MKTRAIVSLFATVIVAAAAISIPISRFELPAANQQPQVCEYGGLQSTAFFGSAVAQTGDSGKLCGESAADSISEAAAVFNPVINLHQSTNQMYITGKGFSSSGRVDVAVHLMSGGTVSPAYSLNVLALDENHFRTSTTAVSCEDPGDRLFVVVKDGEGNEHARIFEPGEFRCASQ